MTWPYHGADVEDTLARVDALHRIQRCAIRASLSKPAFLASTATDSGMFAALVMPDRQLPSGQRCARSEGLEPFVSEGADRVWGSGRSRISIAYCVIVLQNARRRSAGLACRV